MQIELTKDQYKTLLTVMYCGEWVLNSHKTAEDTLSKKTEDLEQLIFSYAKEAGLGKWIEYDDQMNKFFPTEEMESKLHGHIEKYDSKVKRG